MELVHEASSPIGLRQHLLRVRDNYLVPKRGVGWEKGASGVQPDLVCTVSGKGHHLRKHQWFSATCTQEVEGAWSGLT